ncbi:hypothetical protein BDR03DRAFT_996713 [Suillus americanus]|nr:hypothetical protein BDR03DRAFT_996713 [Suillus americanus]
MVYNSPSVSSPRSLRDNPDSALLEAFNINSEGKLTHTLWLFCVLFATCICSSEVMTNLAHSIFPGDNEPTRQSFVEDVKRYLVDIQNHIDNAKETGDEDEEASVSAWSDAPSDARDDPYIHVPQSHMTTETDIDGISKDENNVLASARDSACFISSLHTPTSRSLGLDLPIGIRPDGDAVLALTTKVPSAPSGASQAMVWSSLRRRSSVEEERPQKRLRHSSPHTVVSQEDLPFDISGCVGATNAHRVAQTLALIVVHLCQHRIDSAHVSDVNASNLTAAELGELLDFVCHGHVSRTLGTLPCLARRIRLHTCGLLPPFYQEFGSSTAHSCLFYLQGNRFLCNILISKRGYFSFLHCNTNAYAPDPNGNTTSTEREVHFGKLRVHLGRCPGEHSRFQGMTTQVPADHTVGDKNQNQKRSPDLCMDVKFSMIIRSKNLDLNGRTTHARLFNKVFHAAFLAVASVDREWGPDSTQRT